MKEQCSELTLLVDEYHKCINCVFIVLMMDEKYVVNESKKTKETKRKEYMRRYMKQYRQNELEDKKNERLDRERIARRKRREMESIDCYITRLDKDIRRKRRRKDVTYNKVFLKNRGTDEEEKERQIRKWRRKLQNIKRMDAEKSFVRFSMNLKFNDGNGKKDTCRSRAEARRYERIQDFKFDTLKKISNRSRGEYMSEMIHELNNINGWREDLGIEPLLTILWNVYVNRERCPATNEMIEVRLVNSMRKGKCLL